MLVFSTQKIRCKGDSESFVIPNGKLIPAPDWIGKTEEFKLGLKGGHITVANTKEKKTKAENGDIKPSIK